MELEFIPNNLHLESVAAFKKLDPHLRRMHEQKYKYSSPIIQELPISIPGIYNLGGGRQVGKSTLLKQWMLHLFGIGVKPEAVAFLSCELIVDENSLFRIINNQLSDMPKNGMKYLILDEITYVANWDKAIKYLADIGHFEQVEVIISGSDLVMMQQARKRFPGRRGKADKVDYHFYPLSFVECLQLKNKIKFDVGADFLLTSSKIQMLYDEFNKYLIHGGFLTAINEFALNNNISPQTLATYSDWIRGDVIKHGKSEHYLREILQAILKHYSSQSSWRNMLDSLSIDHTQTLIDYVNLLESMDAVFVQSALIEDKLVGAPKKQRKFIFCDPFIYHAIRAWLNPVKDPFQEQINGAIGDSKLSSQLVEAAVVSHFRRYYPTYYIKAEGEVDIAYVAKNKFWPIELKWTNQLRPKDLKQISKYPRGEIWAKTQSKSEINGTPIYPLPWKLLTHI